MSAPAGWQKGSFRGVPFRTEDQQLSGGRRGALHEFPQAEKPVWEDLGRAARRYRLNVHVVGAEYMAAADALCDALDAPGPGTLVHPWLGAMQVAVPADGWSRRDSTIDGGIAWFDIEFVETGLPAPAIASPDTQAEAVAAADTAQAAAPSLFGGGFSVAGATAFVEQAAGRLVQGAASLVSLRAGLAGGAGSLLRALDGQIGLLGSAGALLREPLRLGQAVVSLVQIMGAIGASSSDKGAAAARAMMDWGDDLDPVIGGTPARALERANQAAIVQLVNLCGAAELVRAHAGTDFASYDDAVAARDDAASRLDALALRQADAGDDAGADQFDTLRRACVRDLTARGGTLARLQSYSPAATEPALVIAQRLYGDPATVVARAGEIVARNKVRHPGFVPGGSPLMILSREAV
ncbi:MAG: DNA circularization protein [Sphingobium sp.]